VAVEISGSYSIYAYNSGVNSVHGGSAAGSGSGDYYSVAGGRIEAPCPYPDHAGEQPVHRSELGGANNWCRACVAATPLTIYGLL